MVSIINRLLLRDEKVNARRALKPPILLKVINAYSFALEHTVDVRPQRAEVRGELQVDIHVDVDSLKLRLGMRAAARGGGLAYAGLLHRAGEYRTSTIVSEIIGLSLQRIFAGAQGF